MLENSKNQSSNVQVSNNVKVVGKHGITKIASSHFSSRAKEPSSFLQTCKNERLSILTLENEDELVKKYDEYSKRTY